MFNGNGANIYERKNDKIITWVQKIKSAIKALATAANAKRPPAQWLTSNKFTFTARYWCKIDINQFHKIQ